MKILFINACSRKESRTLMLAKRLLDGLVGDIEEVNIHNLDIKPFDNEMVNRRVKLAKEGKFDDEIFKYARQFQEADYIVVAAPMWDLSFPSKFKVYIEHINAAGVTFGYTANGPKGFCRAQKLVYLTTSGGEMVFNFGYDYIKMLCNVLYGINYTKCFYAEGLDIWGADVEAILDKTFKKIDDYLVMCK